MSSLEWVFKPMGACTKKAAFQSLVFVSHLPSRKCGNPQRSGAGQPLLVSQFYVVKKKFLQCDLSFPCEFLRETPKEITVSGWFLGHLRWLNMLAMH